ncbi:hypothetical protein KC365_g18547, partial [Hortaea werneckii]
MPSFLKDLRDLRRRSKGSFKTSDTNGSSGNTSSNDGGSDDQPQVNQSSSTLNSFVDKQSPPTTLSSQKSRSSGHLPRLSNGTKTPPLTTDRPRLPSSHSQRYSLVGTNSQNGDLPKQIPATSPLAPRVVSVSDGSWVHQKVLLIYGEAADLQRPTDGTLNVVHHCDGFPQTQWPVCDSHWKALVHLQPGPNKLR